MYITYLIVPNKLDWWRVEILEEFRLCKNRITLSFMNQVFRKVLRVKFEIVITMLKRVFDLYFRQDLENSITTYCLFVVLFSPLWPSAWRQYHLSCHRPSAIFKWVPPTKACWTELQWWVSDVKIIGWPNCHNWIRLFVFY